MKAKTKPASLLTELSAASRRVTPGWTFSAEALADIREVLAANAAGTACIPRYTLARALRRKYSLRASVGTIVRRLAELESAT